jgi:hypothetical protein
VATALLSGWVIIQSKRQNHLPQTLRSPYSPLLLFRSFFKGLAAIYIYIYVCVCVCVCVCVVSFIMYDGSGEKKIEAGGGEEHEEYSRVAASHGQAVLLRI